MCLFHVKSFDNFYNKKNFSQEIQSFSKKIFIYNVLSFLTTKFYSKKKKKKGFKEHYKHLSSLMESSVKIVRKKLENIKEGKLIAKIQRRFRIKQQFHGPTTRAE